eukprot:12395729-Alexandrium_andersonii.AAC.1
MIKDQLNIEPSVRNLNRWPPNKREKENNTSKLGPKAPGGAICAMCSCRCRICRCKGLASAPRRFSRRSRRA